MPAYQGIALSFPDIADLNQTTEVPGTLDIAYTVSGNVKNPVVIALIDGEGWEVTCTEGSITVKAGTDKEASLIVIASDNKGTSITYILKLNLPDVQISGNTYTVYTAEGLLEWNEAAQSRKDLNCTLAADITLPTVAEGESNWTPIDQYTGTFEGNGHTISGLRINGGNGFFKSTYPYAAIRNVIMKDAFVKSTTENTGGISGHNERGFIVNCSFYGEVTGTNRIGGIAGANGGGFIPGYGLRSGTISGCSFYGTVTGTDCVGGIIGANWYSNAISSYSYGEVNGTSSVAGIMGNSHYGSIYACYSNSSISGTSYVGGILGSSSIGGGAETEMSANFWGTYDGTGRGDTSDQGVTKIDNATVNWEDALEAMNTFIDSYEYPVYPEYPNFAPYQYKYVLNEGEDKNIRPLIVVKTSEK